MTAPLTINKSDNAFDLIRWSLALSLFCFHFARISGIPTFLPIEGREIVASFFIMSGYFAHQSYRSHPNAPHYYARRARRILPPYIIVVVLTTIICAAATTLTPTAYATHPHTWQHLSANLPMLGFLAPTLPGVFEGNALAAVNGSLWTMKIEVAFYATIPLLFLLLRRRTTLVLTLIIILSAAYEHLLRHHAHIGGGEQYLFLARQLPGQMSYFASGMLCSLLLPRIMPHRHTLLITTAGLLATLYLIGFTPSLIYAPTLALLITTAGHTAPKPLRHRLPDLTYEVYLLHFPIIQLTTHFLPPGHPLTFTLSAISVIIASILLHGIVRRLNGNAISP